MTGNIYVLKSLNLYKIGKTKNYEQRIRTYKTQNPHGIEKIISIRVKNYDRVEILLHNKYKKKRVVGEWFNLSDKEVSKIIEILLKKATSVLEKIEYK